MKEAIEIIINDGYSNLIAQPPHIISGIENGIMIEEINSYKDKFNIIKIGSPLLASLKDLYKNECRIFLTMLIVTLLLVYFSYMGRKTSTKLSTNKKLIPLKKL